MGLNKINILIEKENDCRLEFKYKNKNTNKKCINIRKEIVGVEEIKEVVKIFKTKNPSYVWITPKPRKYNLEKMLENLEDEYKDKCSGVKSEFVSKGQLNKLALKKAKKKDSKDKRE